MENRLKTYYIYGRESPYDVCILLIVYRKISLPNRSIGRNKRVMSDCYYPTDTGPRSGRCDDIYCHVSVLRYRNVSVKR